MTVHSKDGTTWLTKLERIGVLSANDNNLVFNNIEHLLNADMLKEQYLQLNGNKAVGTDDLIFQLDGKQYRCSETLNMYGDTDLSGAGCSSSARPVL